MASNGGSYDKDQRIPPDEYDSGEIETLPDGSISIPILEEEVVITKRLVVRERIIVKWEWITETRRVETERRKERIEIEETGPDDGGGAAPS